MLERIWWDQGDDFYASAGESRRRPRPMGKGRRGTFGGLHGESEFKPVRDGGLR